MAISSVSNMPQPVVAQVRATQVKATDSDGDNDGSTAAAPAPASSLTASKPTATLGNTINTSA